MRMHWLALLVGCQPPQALEPHPRPSQWVDVTTRPCALDEQGLLFCTTSQAELDQSGWYQPVPTYSEVGRVALYESTGGGVPVLDADGTFRILHCPGDRCTNYRSDPAS